MQPGGTNDILIHFIGYMRNLDDYARETVWYDGEAPRIRFEDDVTVRLNSRPPINDAEDSGEPLDDELSPIVDTIAKVAPAHLLNVTLPPTLARKFEMAAHPSPISYGEGYSITIGFGTINRTIHLTYTGAPVAIVDARQLNQANDDDVFSDGHFKNSDGSLYVQAPIDATQQVGEMVDQAWQAGEAAPTFAFSSTTELATKVSAFDTSMKLRVDAGEMLSHVADGRYINGALSTDTVTLPTIDQIAPWRTADEPAETTVTKTITWADIVEQTATIAEAGQNVQENSALIVDGNEATGSLIVSGDYFFSRGIVQVNVLTDSDTLDIAWQGSHLPTANAGGNVAYNIANFVTHQMTQTAGGASATPNWVIHYVEGDLFDMRSLQQINSLQDNDRITQAEAGTYFRLGTGENEQGNFARVVGLDNYDIIIIGGNYHRADWIYQYNIVYDVDSAKLYAFTADDGASNATAGFNSLYNSAAITTYDAHGFKDISQIQLNLLELLQNRPAELQPDGSWGLAGNASGTLNVLYVSGDYYDVNVITQFNLLVDADQLLQADSTGGAEQGAALGGNAATNVAQIIDPGTLSTSQYLGGEFYEESVLIQVNIITEDDHIVLHDTSQLAPELVAFTEATPDCDCATSSAPAPLATAHTDHLSSGIL